MVGYEILYSIFGCFLSCNFKSGLFVSEKKRDEFKKRLFQFFCVLAPISGFPKYLDTAVRLHIGLQQSSNDFTDFIIDSIK